MLCRMTNPDVLPGHTRLYWYWPFPSRTGNIVAESLAGEGYDLTVESLATRFGERLDHVPDSYTAVRDLPEVQPRRERSPAWVVDRARVYLGRSRRRHTTIAHGDFDVAHVHSLNRFTDPVALTRLRRRVPVVASVHDVLPHQRRMPAAIEGGLARLLYRQCAVLVVAHEVLADRLTAEFGIARDRVCVVPLLIQDPGPDSSVPSAPGDPRGGDLVAPPVNVLFFGVLRRNKGVAELIQAVEGMDATDVVVTFAGRGPDDVEELVRDAARRCGAIRAEVGYVDDDRKDSLFRAADLVVLPYTSMHSQSAVLADAYAYRRPVVVTDVGAVGATVRADGTGWVVPPGDVAALRGALHTACRDAPQRAAMAERVVTVVRRHRLDAVTAGLVTAYDRARDLGTPSR